MWRWRRTFNFPAKSSLILLTAGAGCTVTAIAISDDSPTTFSNSSDKISAGFNGLVRSSRAVFTIASNVIDYKYSLHGLPVASDEYKRILSEAHLRSANRILKLCETNRGFYVKAGQFGAALRQLPAEYSSTLSSLQNQAVPCKFRAIKEVLTRSFKKELTDIFLSFDEQPIAAASIAQVHRAVLKNHDEVAVKVQYPGLDQLVKIDLTTMAFLSNFVTWVFPQYRFGWIVSEFKEAITMELDFVQEAKNSERTANNFRSNKQVKVPKVFWELTTGQVLTMQFCAGHKVDDLDSLKQEGIDPKEVARTLVQVFASMIFIHGFVHRDLHPGNILVAPHGQNRFTLVLLDHGTYKELDEGFRLDYCRLWEALILLDSNRVQELGERFGVGKFTKFLPLIFIGRMINSKASLGKEMSMEEKKAVKEDLKSLKMGDISSFMESLPPDFLTILRTDGLLRSNLSKLGAPLHYRLLTYAKCATYGLSSRSDPEYRSVFAVDVFFSRLKSDFRYLRLRCHLGLLELFALMEDLRYFLTEHYKKLKFSGKNLGIWVAWMVRNHLCEEPLGPAYETLHTYEGGSSWLCLEWLPNLDERMATSGFVSSQNMTMNKGQHQQVDHNMICLIKGYSMNKLILNTYSHSYSFSAEWPLWFIDSVDQPLFVVWIFDME